MASLGPDGYWKISETCRPGRSFVLQVGIDKSHLNSLMQRVKEAYVRFASIPFYSDISNALEQFVLVSSIHGTDSIEGGTLTEEEIKQVFESTNTFVTNKEQRLRILNLKNAYSFAENLIEDKNFGQLNSLSFYVSTSIYRRRYPKIT